MGEKKQNGGVTEGEMYSIISKKERKKEKKDMNFLR